MTDGWGQVKGPEGIGHATDIGEKLLMFLPHRVNHDALVVVVCPSLRLSVACMTLSREGEAENRQEGRP